MENKIFFYNIQIARGIAAILVIMSHTNLMLNPSLFNGLFLPGWSGVHFFFVLSGFIIFWSNSNDIANPKKFKSYAFKRFKRIFPIYWLYTLGILILDLMCYQFMGHHIITWNSLNSSSVIQSFALWPTEVDEGYMPIIPVAWTLSYEVIFYALFGVLIISNRKLSYLIIFTWVLLIFLAAYDIIKTDNNLVFVVLNTYNLEFLLGCIAGYLLKIKFNLNFQAIIILIILGCFLASFSWYNVYTNYEIFEKNIVIQFGIPFFIIVLGLALLDKNKTSNLNKLKKLAVYIGDASYSIYLTHFFVVIGLTILLKHFSLSMFLLQFIFVILTCILVGCIFYSFIEKPLLRWITNKTVKSL